MESTIITFIGTSLERAIAAFILPAAGRLMDVLGPLVVTGVTIYVALIGISLALGVGQKSAGAMVVMALKISLVAALGLNLNTYSTWIVEMFQGLESGLVLALNGQDNTDSIYTVLDGLIGQGGQTSDKAYKLAGDNKFSWAMFVWLFCGFSITIFSALIVGLGAASILVAKFILAVLFAIGPLFILFLMFPITARFLDSWIAQVFNHTLVIVIVSAVLALALVMFGTFLNKADLSGAGLVAPGMVTAEVWALGILLLFALYQAQGVAAGLAGGISSAAITAVHAANLYRGAKRVVNPQSTRRDLESGMQSTGSRLDHLAAGNTLVNMAYSKHLLRSFGRNYSWGSTGGKVKNESAK